MGLHLAFSFVPINETDEDEVSDGDGECEELQMIRLVWAKPEVAG